MICHFEQLLRPISPPLRRTSLAATRASREARVLRRRRRRTRLPCRGSLVHPFDAAPHVARCAAAPRRHLVRRALGGGWPQHAARDVGCVGGCRRRRCRLVGACARGGAAGATGGARWSVRVAPSLATTSLLRCADAARGVCLRACAVGARARAARAAARGRHRAGAGSSAQLHGGDSQLQWGVHVRRRRRAGRRPAGVSGPLS